MLGFPGKTRNVASEATHEAPLTKILAFGRLDSNATRRANNSAISSSPTLGMDFFDPSESPFLPPPRILRVAWSWTEAPVFGFKYSQKFKLPIKPTRGKVILSACQLNEHLHLYQKHAGVPTMGKPSKQLASCWLPLKTSPLLAGLV